MLLLMLALTTAEARDLSRLERPELYRRGVALSVTGFVVGGTGSMLWMGGSLSQAPDAHLAQLAGLGGILLGYPLTGVGASMSARAVRDARYDHPVWPGYVGIASWPFSVAQISINTKALDQMTRRSSNEWRRRELEALEELHELD